MPTVTVFLIRSGETIKEWNDTLPNNATTKKNKLRYHERMDPSLTHDGYLVAQNTLRALIQGICDQTPIPNNRTDSNNDGVIDPIRNMACYSTPLRACQSTALMFSVIGLEQQDKLTWRYTTVDAATSPSAVPIITINGLCAQEEEIIHCGGIDEVMNAGLLHTAAATWNDTRNKCPFMEVCIQDMKATCSDSIKQWKNDRKVYPPRRVLDVQYLYLHHPTDPWALYPLTSKINISIDMLQVDKYLPPPRKGNLNCKLLQNNSNNKEGNVPTSSTNDTYEVVTNCIYKARQVGCDIIFMIVPSSVMQSVITTVGGTNDAITTIQQPCSIISLSAHCNDTYQTVSCNVYGVFTSQQLLMNPMAAVPYYNSHNDIDGDHIITCIVPPPPEKDPASVPTNQWSRFPIPLPENIPDNYPDLPPFASALTVPFPKALSTGRV